MANHLFEGQGLTGQDGRPTAFLNVGYPVFSELVLPLVRLLDCDSDARQHVPGIADDLARVPRIEQPVPIAPRRPVRRSADRDIPGSDRLHRLRREREPSERSLDGPAGAPVGASPSATRGTERSSLRDDGRVCRHGRQCRSRAASRTSGAAACRRQATGSSTPLLCHRGRHGGPDSHSLARSQSRSVRFLCPEHK